MSFCRTSQKETLKCKNKTKKIIGIITDALIADESNGCNNGPVRVLNHSLASERECHDSRPYPIGAIGVWRKREWENQGERLDPKDS